VDEREPFPLTETVETYDAGAGESVMADGGDAVDFASRQAARGKMQLWLTALTAAVALLVLAVVSLSVLRPG
jgi:hypothetical protein